MPVRVISHYEIIEKLGEGGMGVVYKARDPRLGRFVAIKVLPPDKVQDSERKRRFIHEAKAASALNHPNIVVVYDIGSEEGVDFIVMEYIQGKPLNREIPHHGMRLSDALSIAIPVADALANAHAHGIVHRDLKPANIMIGVDQQVKLLDFGLAKLVENVATDKTAETASTGAATDSLTEDGVILGTVSYMSPEQAEGKPLDARSDIFSFGSVMYEMLTGRKAFEQASRIATLSAILNSQTKPLSDLIPAVPREIDRVITRCLQKDPGKRWQSIADLRTLMQEFKQDLDSGVLRGAQPAPNEGARVGRSRLFVGAAVVTLLAASALWLLRGTRMQLLSDTFNVVPVTSYVGTEQEPSLSPDGDQVAFSWDGENQDNFDIYIKRIGPGPPLRLTRHAARDRSPAWSPDGGSIAFLRESKPGRHSVVLIPPLGGPERVIAETTTSRSFQQTLGWTPDGKWLIVFDRPESQAAGLWLLSVESGERRRLTSLPSGPGFQGDLGPAFSPDGRTLAFLRQLASNASELNLLAFGNDLRPLGEPRNLRPGDLFAWNPAWTADGKSLIFAAGPPGQSSLLRIAASDASSFRLTDQVEDFDATISWRSNRLVFSRGTREIDIYRVELDESGEARATSPLITSSRFDRNANYSPDGSKIAFASLRSGSWELWVCDSDGSNPVQLTSLQRNEVRNPLWSADGQEIAFNSNAEGPYQDYIIKATGGKPRKFEADAGPRFRRGLFSPDGKLRYFIRAGSIWSVPSGGGSEQQLFEFDRPIGSLAATGSGIYFVSDETFTKPGDMMFYRFPNGPITKVTTVANPSRYGLSLSPDGRHLLYAKMTTSGSDLMLVENYK